MLSGLGDTLGRALGNVNISIFSSLDGFEALTFWMYIFDFIAYLILFLIGVYYYDNLRLQFTAKVNTEPKPVIK